MQVIINPKITIGSDFSAKIKIENTSNEPRSIKGNISVMSVFYTGVLAHSLLKNPVKLEIEPASGKYIFILF